MSTKKCVIVTIILFVLFGLLLFVNAYLKEDFSGYKSNPSQADHITDLAAPSVSMAGAPAQSPDDSFLLNEGEDKDLQVPNMRCSKSCCGQQWRVPHDMEFDPIACANKNDYVPTNLTCMNQYTSGCVCVPKRLRNYLANRGNNT